MRTLNPIEAAEAAAILTPYFPKGTVPEFVNLEWVMGVVWKVPDPTVESGSRLAVSKDIKGRKGVTDLRKYLADKGLAGSFDRHYVDEWTPTEEYVCFSFGFGA